MADLDCPRSADELYLARGGEVEPYRPVITGDIFEGVTIPGSDGEAGLAMILAHPCSMRRGAHLRSHVQMAPVRQGGPIRLDGWDGNYGVMPLPGLQEAGEMSDRAVFEEAGRVPTDLLTPGRRVACLSTQGILLLLQRLTFNMTRVAVDLDTLLQGIEYVLEEVDLLEDWMRSRLVLPAGENPGTAIRQEEREFDVVLSRVVDGTTLRDGLRDPKSRAAVRRAVRAASARDGG